MTELTKEQREELARPEPIFIDPQTQATYVLVPQQAYERMKTLLALDDYDPDEGSALINECMEDDDPGDPLLDSYQHYGNKK